MTAGRVAVVTGAARGIGQAIALRLAQAGHAVAVGDVRPADETVAAIRAAGGDAVAVGCDLESAAGVELLVGQVTERLGHVDVLVNCAALMLFRPLRELDLDTWRRIQAVNRSLLPADMAGAVAFLASDEAAMITGQTLRIDGGLVML